MKAEKVYSLKDLKDALFPHTPVEVSFEDREYHIYVEGQWHCKAKTIDDVALSVSEIITRLAEDWLFVSTRVNPDWPGWAVLGHLNFVEMYGEKAA